MGTVYKETFTKPLPAGAKIIVRKGKRLAEWKDAKGKTRTAPLTAAGDRIAVEAGTYSAKYRDGSGIVRKISTGCRDEAAARSVLTELERRAELVKAKVLTVAEDAVADHQGTPLGDHFALYLTHLEAEGTSPDHRENVNRCLRRIAVECRLTMLADLNRDVFEGWLVVKTREGMGARTRNLHRASAVALCNWCVATRRLTRNPLAQVKKADEEADPRRKRRALTENELIRLLDVARRRPLLDAMTIRRGKRKGEAVARLQEQTRRALEALGWERALMYKTLVLTGLRKGELASLTIGQLDLDADPPFLVLDAADEKNREGNSIPLRADLATDLRGWLAEKATALQDAASEAPAVWFDSEAVQPRKRNRSDSGGFSGQSWQQVTSVYGLPADTPVFTVPRDLVRILDRDLRAAGIPKRDERGRTVDVHALRHTFGTLLSKGGVAPRTAQAAMRHSTIDLTMNTYTDPKLLDVAGAMEALPTLPLVDGRQREAAALSATGTDHSTPSPLVPLLVPTSGKPGVLQSIIDKVASAAGKIGERGTVAISAYAVKENNPLTTAVNGLQQERETGFEPATSSLGS